MGAQGAHVDPAEPVAEHVDGSTGGESARAQHRHQRRLARAVRAEQCPVLAGQYPHADVVEQQAALRATSG